MTDSKKPPSREEFEQLREAFATQAELIDEYLPDDPQKRKFLGEAAKGIGAVGALGIAGQSGYAVGQASAEASTSDTDTDIGSPNNRHDVFAEGVDANSVNTESVNNIEYASQYDDETDGLKTAIENAGANGYVWAGYGGGSGPNGEYMLAPGSGGYGLGVYGVTDLTLAGNGVLKIDAANAANDYRAIINDGPGWTYKGITLDGSRSELTDGGNLLQQLGIYGNGSYNRIVDVTIRNCMYGGIRVRTADETINRGIKCINNGGSARWDKSGTDNALRNAIQNFVSIDCGGSSAANFGGLVIGDGCNNVSVTNAVIKPVAGEGALRVEASDNVSVSGVQAEGVVSIVGPITNSDIDVSISGGSYVRVDGGVRGTNVSATVDNPDSYGALVTGVRRTNNIDVTVTHPGQTSAPAGAIIVEGCDAGGCLDFTIRGSNNGSFPGVLLRNDGTNDTVGWTVSGHVEGAGGITYAVEAADAAQTALVDGVATENIVTGVVNNPGGLVVGDTANL